MMLVLEMVRIRLAGREARDVAHRCGDSRVGSVLLLIDKADADQ